MLQFYSLSVNDLIISLVYNLCLSSVRGTYYDGECFNEHK